ncbi:hypothetical protein BH09PSE5_BH09PSE5_20100 [soil metagenome]
MQSSPDGYEYHQLRASTMTAKLLRSLAGVSIAVASLSCVAPCFAADPEGAKPSKAQLDRGRYLVRIGGCNDCHTPGYGEANGNVPESAWLTGVPLGWKGPWGTTYASNLRTYFRSMKANEWVKAAKALKARPPMPWFTVNAMTEPDLRAMYAYVYSLGPAGGPVPDYVPPGVTPSGPFVSFPEPPKK